MVTINTKCHQPVAKKKTSVIVQYPANNTKILYFLKSPKLRGLLKICLKTVNNQLKPPIVNSCPSQ